jgi:hypothetical protein
MLDGERRVAVSGPAGSGKTLLAAEKARRLADQGFEVLLTCFNRPLADHVRAGLGDVEGVHVAGFHELCFDLCREAGSPRPAIATRGSSGTSSCRSSPRRSTRSVRGSTR